VQGYGLLTECVIAGAGHLAPMDQPARALDMVGRFVEGKPWGKDEAGASGVVVGVEEEGPEAAAATAVKA
jgi:hypothetical protein